MDFTDNKFGSSGLVSPLEALMDNMLHTTARSQQRVNKLWGNTLRFRKGKAPNYGGD